MANKVTWNGDKLLQKTRKDSARSLRRIGTMLVADIRRSMAGDRFGSTKVGRKTVRHPAPPGEPPAVQTARLTGSIAYELADERTLRVGTNVVYGKYLELGTRRMAPRPFLVPALIRNRRAIEEELRGGFRM